MKKYEGNIPDTSEGWRLALTIHDDRVGVDWLLFSRRSPLDPGWINYKLVADGKAPMKSNYWFSKRERTGHLGHAKDFANLRKNRPQVHKAVEAYLGRKESRPC